MIDNNKGAGVKTPDFTQTPEFQAAVQAAATAAAKQVREELSTLMAEKAADVKTGSGESGDLEGLFRQMALAIAEVSDQGTDRKRVAPEILVAREKARIAMFGKIQHYFEAAKAARHNGESVEDLVPVYKLISKVYLDEVLIDPVWRTASGIIKAQEIEWPGVPNEAMRPLNGPAIEIYDLFISSIGNSEFSTTESYVVTPKGLVVRGQASRGQPSITEAQEGSVGVKIRGREAMDEVKPLRVLGTVAQPAQETGMVR
jgi:hypothetical protein